jgi:hypothetical protein
MGRFCLKIHLFGRVEHSPPRTRAAVANRQLRRLFGELRVNPHCDETRWL